LEVSKTKGATGTRHRALPASAELCLLGMIANAKSARYRQSSAARATQAGQDYGSVERVRCSGLLGASDKDRCSAAMFYYGYLAAKAGIRTIDVSPIDDHTAKVVHQVPQHRA
jgi:hypothetical protein